jgi:ubiquitin fusion degradation protein 1
MAQAINYDAIAPGAPATLAGNFHGEGQRLSSKKSSKTSTPKPATPVAGVSSTAKEVMGKRRNGGPAPLRLPPNKLFLGYEIRPVKTAEDKEKEAANAKQPHFAGQGQTLRGTVKKDDKSG